VTAATAPATTAVRLIAENWLTGRHTDEPLRRGDSQAEGFRIGIKRPGGGRGIGGSRPQRATSPATDALSNTSGRDTANCLGHRVCVAHGRGWPGLVVWILRDSGHGCGARVRRHLGCRRAGLAARHRSVLSTAVLFLAVGFVTGPGVANLVTVTLASRRAPARHLALFSVLFTDGMAAGFDELRLAWRLPGRPCWSDYP